MRQGGKLLGRVMTEVLAQAKPGLRLVGLDSLAESLIKKFGGQPSFKMVPGYHWATCLNINQGVVHGIPNQYQLQQNDLLSVDIGFFYQGFHTDMARTVGVKERDDKEKKDKFLTAGEQALREAINVVKPGKRVGHISRTIEGVIKRAGFAPVRVLTGHGVGKGLHEEPQIPCFLAGRISETPRLRPGMTLALEVIYAQGDSGVILEKDGWTISTRDRSLAGLFEDTVVVTADDSLALTAMFCG